MINIKTNTINKITSDIAFNKSSIWFFKEIQTNSWYIFLITDYSENSKRFTIWEMNQNESFLPIEQDKIEYDVVYFSNIYYFISNEFGRCLANLPIGQYDVYSITNDANYVIINQSFKELIKDNIKQINNLTADDNFALYLKYNATICNVSDK